ncbi:organic cation transporter-like protein isoform X2 [Apostichopus japonicus]|uniref:organic cation transporter-like protein isoform X2 n=1 Tax=Stichopus japonicus TaxID=307972 RepID=UPI003AB66F53
MELDEALEAAKPLGRTQLMILLASMLMNMESGFSVLSNVFLAKTPPYHCANHSGFSLEESVPFIDGSYSTCEVYSDPVHSNDTQPCNMWYFDTEKAGKSVVSDWDLVCARDFLPGVGQSLILAGFAVGSILGGPVADKYGKKPTLLISLVIFNAVGLSVSLSQGFIAFGILRFLMGTIFKAVRIPLINLMFEYLVPRYRSLVGILPFIMGSVGLVIMSGIAYLVRDWRYLNIVLMTPTLSMMIFSWLLPESIRWSLSRGYIKKAEETMQKVAAFNKAKDFPLVVFDDQHPKQEGNSSENVSDDESQENCKSKSLEGFRFIAQLFQPPTLTVSLVLSWAWLTCTLVYFGFALTTGSLAGDPYLNFCLSSLVDIPAALVSLFLIKKIGSLVPLIAGLVLAAVLMILIIILPFAIDKDVLSGLLTTLALMGRFSITLAIPPMFLLMSDLFPTPIRNSGTSLVQLIGNIGSLSAPLVIYMNKFFANLAFLVMVLCALLAAGLALLLPDTLNTKQLETVDDLKVLFATKTIFSRRKNEKEDAETDSSSFDKHDTTEMRESCADEGYV